MIRQAINAEFKVVHPEKPFIEGVIMYVLQQARSPETHGKNAVLINDVIDRSPWYGTCAVQHLCMQEAKLV